MRNLIFPIFIGLFDLFVFQAFLTLSADWSDGWSTVLYAAYWAVPLLAVFLILRYASLGRAADRQAWFVNARTMVIGAYLSKFLIAMVLLVEDAGRLLWQLAGWLGLVESGAVERIPWISQGAVLLAMSLFAVLVYGIFRNKYRYRLFRERIAIAGLPERLKGLRIVQISDIHSGSFTDPDRVREGVDLINSQKPDLVFFTGDLVNNIAREMRGYINIFDKIEARYGVYSILGNHDYGDYVRWPDSESKRQNFQELLEVHRRMGWDLMLNEHRMLKIEGEEVAVIGVENYSAHGRFRSYGDLVKAYGGAEKAVLKLLLSHDPTHWEDQVLSDFPDIDVTFSGHTHGMQFGIEIPGWFRWSPAKYVYKQWAGLYQRGRQFLYVNRGFGFLGYPGRVGILPEVTLVELV